jgi:hypothetical protein
MNKQHILNEIKRTAQENGGMPLGINRFSQETGIRVHEWSGKYWARWSDALKEAGFAPNKFVTEGQGEDALIKQYAVLVRELGKIPVKAEIGLKRRKDPSFPTAELFHKRFGSKSRLLTKLREHCLGDSSFTDVASLIPIDFSDHDDTDGVPVDRGEIEAGGFVYLIRSGRHYKIGKSNAFGRREYELAIQLPEKARTVHVIRAIDDASGIEAYWHKRFDDKRANGEWFALDSEDVRAFKRRKLM